MEKIVGAGLQVLTGSTSKSSLKKTLDSASQILNPGSILQKTSEVSKNLDGPKANDGDSAVGKNGNVTSCTSTDPVPCSSSEGSLQTHLRSLPKDRKREEKSTTKKLTEFVEQYDGPMEDLKSYGTWGSIVKDLRKGDHHKVERMVDSLAYQEVREPVHKSVLNRLGLSAASQFESACEYLRSRKARKKKVDVEGEDGKNKMAETINSAIASSKENFTPVTFYPEPEPREQDESQEDEGSQGEENMELGDDYSPSGNDLSTKDLSNSKAVAAQRHEAPVEAVEQPITDDNLGNLEDSEMDNVEETFDNLSGRAAETGFEQEPSTEPASQPSGNNTNDGSQRRGERNRRTNKAYSPSTYSLSSQSKKRKNYENFCCGKNLPGESYVECENNKQNKCPTGGWYHFTNSPPCVEFDTTLPKNIQWFCPSCKKSDKASDEDDLVRGDPIRGNLLDAWSQINFSASAQPSEEKLLSSQEHNTSKETSSSKEDTKHASTSQNSIEKAIAYESNTVSQNEATNGQPAPNAGFGPSLQDSEEIDAEQFPTNLDSHGPPIEVEEAAQILGCDISKDVLHTGTYYEDYKISRELFAKIYDTESGQLIPGMFDAIKKMHS